MRYFPFISCAAGLLVCSLGTPAAAQDVPTPVAEINTFLDRWHHAAAVSDEAAYFGALDSTAVYLGTDPDERWSKQAFHEWAKPHFARKSAWDLTPFGRHVTLAPGGAIAWFDEKIKWFDTPLNTWMGTWRGTGVVHRTAAGWRILQYNLTMELPNDRLGDVVHLLRVSRAVDPGDKREIMAVARDSISRLASRGAARDSIAEATVLGDGTVAVVWAPFTTYEAARPTGCGLALFQLVKVRSAWRITSLAVHPRERCAESETK